MISSRHQTKLPRQPRWLGIITGALFLILLLVMALKLPSDPDLGWHLRNGADIIANLRFPAGDIYSWTMIGYPWTSHEWASDVLMATIYSWTGLWGLVIAFMLLVAGIFYVAAGAYATSWLNRVVVAIIALLVSWNIVGVRPQMITLFGVAIVLYLLFRFRSHPKSKLIYWLPAIFLLWANLHGGFPVGFIVIGLFIVGEFIRRVLLGRTKRQSITDLLSVVDIRKLVWLGLGSFAVTFINPNGWRVYLELFQTFGNREILNSIAEWLGVNLFSAVSYNMAILAILILALLFINRWRVDITKLVMVTAIFLFSITSWRHIPLFAIVALPLLAEQFEYLMGRGIYSVTRHVVTPIMLLSVILVMGYGFFAAAVPALKSPRSYGRTFGFPYEAVEYLKEHPSPTGKLLNEYDFGGYLTWQYPEQKVFIDGRMAIWKWRGIEIFQEFRTLLGIDKEDALKGLERWDIDTILTRSTHPIGYYLSGEEDKWSQVYSDPLFVVWQRSGEESLQ